MAIRKCKFEKSSTILEVEDDNARASKSIIYRSSDKRDPAFEAAMQALLPDVESLLELGEDYLTGTAVVTVDGEVFAQHGKVTSVSFSENDHQGFGAVVTVLRKIDGINSPLVLNSPHTHEDACEQGNSVMPSGMMRRCKALYDWAERFYQGEARAQETLALEGGDDGAK